MTGGFGLAFLRGEGKPIHPDDDLWDDSYPMTDEFYIMQLQAYKDAYKESFEETYCSRPHLKDKLK